jgi:hypothetical protein
MCGNIHPTSPLKIKTYQLTEVNIHKSPLLWAGKIQKKASRENSEGFEV